MSREVVFESVRGHLASGLEVDAQSIEERSNLVTDLDADSLDLLELILLLNDEFDISVSDGEVKVLLTELAQFLPDPSQQQQNFSDEELAEVAQSLTVGTIVDFIESRVDAAPG